MQPGFEENNIDLGRVVLFTPWHRLFRSACNAHEATHAVETMTRIFNAVAEVVVETSERDGYLAKKMVRSIYLQFVDPCVQRSACGKWVSLQKFAVSDTILGAMVRWPST